VTVAPEQAHAPDLLVETRNSLTTPFLDFHEAEMRSSGKRLARNEEQLATLRSCFKKNQSEGESILNSMSWSDEALLLRVFRLHFVDQLLMLCFNVITPVL